MNHISRITGVLCGLFVWMAVVPESSAAGKGRWQNLLKHDDLSAWRRYCGTGFPQEGWEVKEGCLHLLRGGKGGELVTVEQFDNFEFEWEWKIVSRGNNGIKYFVTEARPDAPGPEYQMIDDAVIPDAKHQTAAFYDVLPVTGKKKLNPPGEWNKSRLVVQGLHVEHWLNGVKVLSYELDSPEVKAGLANSKFKNAPGFGEKIKGHLLLTNHDRETWFRAMRIRTLPPK